MSSHSDTFTFNSGFLGYSRSGGFGRCNSAATPSTQTALHFHTRRWPATKLSDFSCSGRSETSEREDLRCHCHLKPNHIIGDLDRIVADLAV